MYTPLSIFFCLFYLSNFPAAYFRPIIPQDRLLPLSHQQPWNPPLNTKLVNRHCSSQYLWLKHIWLITIAHAQSGRSMKWRFTLIMFTTSGPNSCLWFLIKFSIIFSHYWWGCVEIWNCKEEREEGLCVYDHKLWSAEPGATLRDGESMAIGTNTLIQKLINTVKL